MDPLGIDPEHGDARLIERRANRVAALARATTLVAGTRNSFCPLRRYCHVVSLRYSRRMALRISKLSAFVSVVTGLAALIPASASAVPCGSQNQARCDFGNVPDFSEVEFGHEIADELDDLGLKGWSLTVIDRDGIEAVRVSQGFADSADGQPFYATTASGIGSISKVFTEAAIRHAIELNQELPNTMCAGAFTLDTPFLDVLPPVFSEVAHWSYADVSIEQILVHAGGVPITHNLDEAPPGSPHWNRKYTYYDMMTKTNIETSCQEGAECYNNDNYVLATMMLPIIHNCGNRAFVDAWSTAACSDVVNPAARAECEIQYAFDMLGSMSNYIIEDWILDPLDIEATCDPRADPVINGQNVALGYAHANDPVGVLPREDVRACGVGRWFMTSQDLARAMRYVGSGSFFIDRANADALPYRHSGLLRDTTTPSETAVYTAWFESRPGDFYYAFETNQSLDVNPTDEPGPDDTIRAVFEAAREITLLPQPPLIAAIRGDWNCERIGAGADVLLQSYGRYDTRVFLADDQQGDGAKELWTVTAQNGSSANGSYVYYDASGSPNDDVLASGTWSLQRTTQNRLKMTRRDVNGWTGNYICSMI
jgi:hypothetical protein